jgi:ABC-type branched-subunit amino acid transport system ATPase component
LREDGMTLIVVEQLASMVLEAADRGYVLEHGRVQLEGLASLLRGHPEVQRRYLGTIDRGALEA